MKIILFLSLLLMSLSLRAEDVEILVEPKEAIVNESFFVTFKVKATGSEEPYISFTPFGASVLGKRSQGISISTVVINGKFTTTKEQAIVYELLAERSGQVYLRNIKVEMGAKTIPVKEVRVNVLNEPRRIPDAFMEVEASKSRVYLGEGLDVNYYLYFKNSITANDVKEFPKLNKFIKRFHHINSPVETVQYKGQVLKRILAYSARLYPEKIGTAVLDPMKISVQIIENDYSGFGFGSQRYKNKDLSSPRVEIEVLPLPAEGVPASFTGLVGEHEFSVTVPKSKYLINEPIELKLEVKGKGAVENFDAPVLYADKNLESFDTKSEVTEIGTQAAKKLFEYTLLARGPLKIEARSLQLAYFDPTTSRYIEKKIPLPELEVSGVAAPSESNQTATVPDAGPKVEDQNNFINTFFGEKKDITKNTLGLVAPVMNSDERWSDKALLILNFVLISMLLGIGIQWGYGARKRDVVSDLYSSTNQGIKRMKKQGLSYSELYRTLSVLDKMNKMSNGGISIVQIIDESNLSFEAKEYFKKALESTEGMVFSSAKKSSKEIITFNKKHFSELLKNL